MMGDIWNFYKEIALSVSVVISNKKPSCSELISYKKMSESIPIPHNTIKEFPRVNSELDPSDVHTAPS